MTPVEIFLNQQVHNIIKDSGFLQLSILPALVLDLAHAYSQMVASVSSNIPRSNYSEAQDSFSIERKSFADTPISVIN